MQCSSRHASFHEHCLDPPLSHWASDFSIETEAIKGARSWIESGVEALTGERTLGVNRLLHGRSSSYKQIQEKALIKFPGPLSPASRCFPFTSA